MATFKLAGKYFLFSLIFFTGNISIAQTSVTCDAQNRSCMTDHILNLAEQIEETRWRDQTYREAAKTMAADGRADAALLLIDKIETPDTKALTIRGIGMEAAMAGKVTENLFAKLRTETEKITHPPSYGIALTYIAMAQAYAGDDAGAAQTASDMQNEDLRNKAYGETAEIQAEKGKFSQAMQSINAIQSVSFKNKAYKTVSSIFADQQQYQEAFNTAINITNPVMEAEAIQFILDKQRQEMEKARD